MFKVLTSNYLIKASASAVLLSLSILTAVYATVSVTDDQGNDVVLQKPAKRIISLAPHITESLFAAGAGDKIIGAVSYSDYPEAAKKIPRVGGYPTADIEKIISLKPDLIIAWPSGNNLKQVEKLRAFGINIYMSEPRYPEDIAKTIQRFGVLAGSSNIANKSRDDFMQHYKLLKNRFSKKQKVRVFYQIWNKPLMTINGQHLISNIIELCGGTNVFHDLQTITPKISVEAVIATNAEVIVAGGMGKKRPEWVTEWKQWKQLPAVKNEQIHFVNPDILQRVGPRILQGADELCEILEQVRAN